MPNNNTNNKKPKAPERACISCTPWRYTTEEPRIVTVKNFCSMCTRTAERKLKEYTEYQGTLIDVFSTCFMELAKENTSSSSSINIDAHQHQTWLRLYESYSALYESQDFGLKYDLKYTSYPKHHLHPIYQVIRKKMVLWEKLMEPVRDYLWNIPKDLPAAPSHP